MYSKNIYGVNKLYSNWYLGFFQAGKISKECINSWCNKINHADVYELSLHLGDNNRELENFLKWEKVKFYADWEGEFKAINSFQYN